jgi:hypothetical protein
MSRDWISKHGTKRQRHTTIVFALRHPSVVQFVLVRVSPDCRRVGRFRVVGHRGVNRVRLGPRVGRHSLRPGTYRLIARAVPGGRTLVDTRLVVVTHASHDEIEAARGADTCSPATSSEGGAQASGTAGTQSTAGPRTSKAESTSKPDPHQGVLGAKFARKAAEAASRVPIWLYTLVALAIVLLAAGAFLPKARPAGLAASLVFGLTGAMVLLLAMVAYLVL